jgi:hypothetical protein
MLVEIRRSNPLKLEWKNLLVTLSLRDCRTLGTTLAFVRFKDGNLLRQNFASSFGLNCLIPPDFFSEFIYKHQSAGTVDTGSVLLTSVEEFLLEWWKYLGSVGE